MLGEIHRSEDGAQILMGTHTVTGEKYYISLVDISIVKHLIRLT